MCHSRHVSIKSGTASHVSFWRDVMKTTLWLAHDVNVVKTNSTSPTTSRLGRLIRALLEPVKSGFRRLRSCSCERLFDLYSSSNRIARRMQIYSYNVFLCPTTRVISLYDVIDVACRYSRENVTALAQKRCFVRKTLVMWEKESLTRRYLIQADLKLI